ncbi:MAG: ABC transporter permease [Deltaproteobacteria bacterium]|nr:ABC transporter permease [Deltaproteobacteria bacterium]MCL4874862.1 ABC transporter permease [bacterium]
MPVILATDFIVFFLAGAVIYFAFAVRRDGAAASAWREIRKNRLAMACLAVLALYFSVALLDSIRYRDPVINEDGVQAMTEEGSALYSAQALSLLDRAFEGMRTNHEKTYSAPFARQLFVKENIELTDGTTVREYAPLKHPGAHFLGTDKVGNDVFFNALKGIRTAVVIGAGTTLIIVPFAIFFGVVAGYFGGILDDIVQYIYTTLASIPGVLLIVAFMLLFGTTGYQGGLISEGQLSLGVFVFNDRLFWLALILGITSWTDLCRLIRGETLKLRELEYVQASRAFGVSRPGIIYRHIVPNVMHLVLITFVLQFSALVLAEAILSYIGIGVGPQMGSWGNMINTSRLELSMDPVVWWNLTASFLFMFGLVLPANIFGDAVRDALDPRLRYR